MKKILIILGLLTVLILSSCTGWVTHSGESQGLCQPKCVNENLTLYQVVTSENGYICYCRKVIEVQNYKER